MITKPYEGFYFGTHSTQENKNKGVVEFIPKQQLTTPIGL